MAQTKERAPLEAATSKSASGLMCIQEEDTTPARFLQAADIPAGLELFSFPWLGTVWRAPASWTGILWRCASPAFPDRPNTTGKTAVIFTISACAIAWTDPRPSW